jgi:dTDP-4-amino-4,6-dideoxygalactose transaminase
LGKVSGHFAQRIPVIEDAAQAIRADYQERPVGSLGSMGCLSFFPSKNLGGAGDGGMITTNHAAVAAAATIACAWRQRQIRV